MVSKKDWKDGFAKTLMTLITQRGISINKLATETGIDAKSIRNYLGCSALPSAYIISVLSDYFGVSADYFIFGNNNVRGTGSHIGLLGIALMQYFDLTLQEYELIYGNTVYALNSSRGVIINPYTHEYTYRDKTKSLSEIDSRYADGVLDISRIFREHLLCDTDKAVFLSSLVAEISRYRQYLNNQDSSIE